MAGKKVRKLSDARLVALAKDLITTEDFDVEVAKRHSISKDYLSKIKKSDRFLVLYDKLLNSYCEGKWQ